MLRGAQEPFIFNDNWFYHFGNNLLPRKHTLCLHLLHIEFSLVKATGLLEHPFFQDINLTLLINLRLWRLIWFVFLIHLNLIRLTLRFNDLARLHLRWWHLTVQLLRRNLRLVKLLHLYWLCAHNLRIYLCLLWVLSCLLNIMNVSIINNMSLLWLIFLTVLQWISTLFLLNELIYILVKLVHSIEVHINAHSWLL